MEQLLRAHESSDLGEAVDGVPDVDWLRAAGMVSQRHPLALAVWRLTEQGDKRAVAECYSGMLDLCRGMALTNPMHVVASVLTWMAAPRCRTCFGRGHPLIPGTPTLSDQPCETCHGSGDKVPEWGDHEKTLYELVRDEQRQAAAAIVKKLRD